MTTEHQPDFTGLPKRKLDELLAQGYRITGYAIERDVDDAEPVRGFITVGGLVGWWSPNTQAEIDRLRAQVRALTSDQAPIAEITAIDEFGPCFGWYKHWATTARVGMKLYTRPAPAPTRPAVPNPITEEMHQAAVKVLTRANGLDGTPQRMLDAMLAAAPQAEAPIKESSSVLKLPDGWVPCTVKFENGYPEEVAYGPQRMMDRLQKWLSKHFAREIRDALRDSAGDAAKIEAYASLTPKEVHDLTCMQAGAPWDDAPLSALVEIIKIYEKLRGEGKRPVDPATLPKDQVRFPYVAPQAERCTYCDDTGDVTNQTGEWRGYCICEAGQALKGQKGGA